MEELSDINERLKAARDDAVSDIDATIAKLDEKETGLNARMETLALGGHAKLDASDDDLVEVTAGGTIVAARRSTLTQVKGTRFEALFSGRWDKKLQRDSQGRIFLDVNPVGFRAIVDYLAEMAISSEDDPPSPPSVCDGVESTLRLQLKLFGLGNVKMPDSNIITTAESVECLHDWLEADGSDGQLQLLYRGSRDGLTAEAFHSKCDDKGPTLTVIETEDGYVFGGYSNTPWTTGESSSSWKRADKSFLFVLSGSDILSPCKMKLLNPKEFQAVFHAPSLGPYFGAEKKTDLTIKEMEVFLVTGSTEAPVLITNARANKRELPQVEPFARFAEDVNEALNAKQSHLLQSESEVLRLEDERNFIEAFAGGDAEDVIALNVCGAKMATKRATLCVAEESVLARQFDDSKWNEPGIGPRVKEWTPDDVASWADSIEGIPVNVGRLLKENDITGPELLALNIDGLEKLGIERTGTQCLLVKEIQALEKASQDIVTLIEHSPYCFGKILDYLRWKRLHSQRLTKKPALPKVCDTQKSRFEKVLSYYFPGQSSEMMFGEKK